MFVDTNLAPDYFSMRAENIEGNSSVRFAATPPTAQSWAVGHTYDVAQISDADHAGLSVAKSSYACGSISGKITILEAVRDGASLTAFAASYEIRCDASTHPLSGDVRWNSSVGYQAAVTSTAQQSFGAVEIGEPGPVKSVSIRSLGSEPVVLQTAALTGADPGAFSITVDTCSGRTLTPDTSCTVTIQAKPITASAVSAELIIPDGTTAGERFVKLDAVGFHGARGTYYPHGPRRIMDTRSGVGAPKAKLGAGQTLTLQVTGRVNVPYSGVGSVTMNVTVANTTATSFLTLYPAGETRPTASSINFPARWVGSNFVTVKLSPDGKVAIYNNSGSADVIIDITGYYGASTEVIDSKYWDYRVGGHYQWVRPFRLFDTRSAWKAKLPANNRVRTWISFGDEITNRKIRAFVVNITAVEPKYTGYLTAWDGVYTPVPNTSTVNYLAGRVTPNLAVVPTVVCLDCRSDRLPVPSIGIFTSQDTHVIVDVVGVIDDGTLADGLRFRPLSPTRIVDSRIYVGADRLSQGETAKITVSDTIVTPGTEVLATNLTAIRPTASTYLTAWPADLGISRPTVSNLNPAAGAVVANGVMATVGPLRGFYLYNNIGSLDFAIDVVGTYYRYPGTASSTAGGTSVRPADDRALTVVGGGGELIR
ncbi:MAG: choice-of-anchor D domain-containing protein [Hamadaea sp.]|nr:choice-of-anchor D domain-containing protein [Hamadaea sp.]